MLSRAICCLFFVSGAPLAVALDFTDDSLAVVKENVTEKKAILVDVRSKFEWDKGRVAGAIFLPITALEEMEPVKLATILPKKKILYTYCAVGMRAQAAGEILEEHGYEVRVLQPGYDKLIKAGFKKADKKSAKKSDKNAEEKSANENPR